MKSIARALATTLVGAVMAAVPAAAQNVNIDYDHSVNFLKFKTYTWDKVQATDPSVAGRITIALNRDMAGRYMTEAPKGGDVTITAVEATKDKGEFADFYKNLGDLSWQRSWGSNGFLDSPATVDDVPLGTLVIDIYDTKTHKLLWRGAVATELTGSENNMDNAIDKAVTQLISKYPPKYKKP